MIARADVVIVPDLRRRVQFANTRPKHIVEIMNVPEDQQSGSITEAIIAMAKRLKLRCIAEGVETRQQLDFLRANQCEAFQGFLFSKAVTALEATAMLKAQAVDDTEEVTAAVSS